MKRNSDATIIHRRRVARGAERAGEAGRLGVSMGNIVYSWSLHTAMLIASP
jgi:hypothetical protein